MKKYRLTIIILSLILIADQVTKILVKTTMVLGTPGEKKVIGDWFRLHFIENNGMAFGLEFGGDVGKIALTIFRIIASIAIAWYLNDLIKRGAPKGFIISITFILAGAIGNIIDSVFYGIIFNDSTYFQPAVMFPEGGGYSGILKGKVVDMLYFPVIDTYLPDWFPFWPNKHFIFFRPVFNIADSAVTSGVMLILLFQKRFFKEEIK